MKALAEKINIYYISDEKTIDYIKSIGIMEAMKLGIDGLRKDIVLGPLVIMSGSKTETIYSDQTKMYYPSFIE